MAGHPAPPKIEAPSGICRQCANLSGFWLMGQCFLDWQIFAFQSWRGFPSLISADCKSAKKRAEVQRGCGGITSAHRAQYPAVLSVNVAVCLTGL